MSDLNDLNKPTPTDTEPNVLDTLRAHLVRAITWAGYSATANKVAGLMSATTEAVVGGGRSMRLYRRNDANTADEEIVSLPGVIVGGASGTVSVTGDQTIDGTKTFSTAPVLQGVMTGTGGGGQDSNTRYGKNALVSNTTGYSNTAIGRTALYSNTTGANNTGLGAYALWMNTTGADNTAVGASALSSNTTGSDNVAFGVGALDDNTTGYSNTAIGESALLFNTTGYNNTAVGQGALTSYLGTGQINCMGLGFGAVVTGNNQVQLGNSSTTTYVYGTVQNRSDLLDKTDVRDTLLGLDFINALRPVDYRWDMREDYRPERPAAFAQPEPGEDATEQEISIYQEAKAAHKQAMAEWAQACRLENLVRDGSKKRSRYHHGLIAQEVKALLDAQDIEFGGYQDHSVNGGDAVKSIGYDELIAPLIKAVQQLSARVVQLESTQP